MPRLYYLHRLTTFVVSYIRNTNRRETQNAVLTRRFSAKPQHTLYLCGKKKI